MAPYILSLVLAGIALAYNPFDKTPQSWYSCNNDNDCQIVDTGCYVKAVNKNYIQEYRSWIKSLEAASSCEVPNSLERKKLRAICKKHKCEAEGGK